MEDPIVLLNVGFERLFEYSTICNMYANETNKDFLIQRNKIYLQTEIPFSSFFSTTMHVYRLIYAWSKN